MSEKPEQQHLQVDGCSWGERPKGLDRERQKAFRVGVQWDSASKGSVSGDTG